ncbi:hypothetical protein GGR56DRAFT_298600 [Xylariaceae sp. FL0804]|nr:hypothetical protein GGR56DRAFT_298600 [Xylariaceae sp. FL0804]
MARSRKFKCLVLVLSGFVGLQMTAADSNNSEADFVYPNGDKTTYHYGDTIEVQWTSIWPAPWLYTWCRFGKDEVIEGVQKQQVPTNGTQSIHMNFGDGNKCWFNLKEDEYSQHGNGVNSPSFQFKQNGGNNKIFAASTTMPPSSASTSTSTSTTGEASSVTATTTAKSSSGLSNGARIGIGVGVGLGVGGIALGAVGALLWARYRSRRRRGGGGKGSSSSSSRARRRSSSDHKEVRYQKAYPEAQLQQQQQTPVTVTDRQELDGSMPHELPARDSRLYPR